MMRQSHTSTLLARLITRPNGDSQNWLRGFQRRGIAALACAFILLAASWLAAAPVPDTLLTTLQQPPGFQAGGQEGILVAVDGTTVAVAARAEKNPTDGREAMPVRIYRAGTGELLHTLWPDVLGDIGSLAVSGSRVAVGEDFFGDVHVFDLSSTNPAAPVLTIHGPSFFGRAVAMDGRRLVVGGNDDEVFVYDLNSATPSTPVHILSHYWGDFGRAVAVSGSLVAVGAPDFFNVGKVFVFDVTSASPSNVLYQIDGPPPLSAEDEFGSAVALDGTKLVVGTWRESDPGRAYFYDLAGANPTNHVFSCQNPDGDPEFGSAVAIHSTRLFVGSPRAAGSGRNQGRVFAYTFTNREPVEIFENPTPANGDRFGTAVAAKGVRLVVGAPYDDTRASDAGAAYSYSLSSATPTVPVATLNETGPDLGDEFGAPVAFSGAFLAAAARGDAVDADRTGTVGVYAASGSSNLTRSLTLSSPDSASFFGHALALDGARLAVGDPYGSGGGKVYIYNLAGGSPGTPAFILANPTSSPSEQFGSAVAVSGNRVAVGCYAPPSGEAFRRVYVFDLGSATPTVPTVVLRSPVERFVFSDSGFALIGYPQEAAFGGQLALEGTRLAVLENPISALNLPGRVHVFDLGAAEPMQAVYTIAAPSGAVWASDGFANTSLSLSRSRLAVNSVIAPGNVQVFNLSSATPTVPWLTVTNATDAGFGYAANLHGPRLVVSGLARLYVYDLRRTTPASPVAVIGVPTGVPALFNAYLAVGLPSEDIPTEDQGVVRLYGPGTNAADLTFEYSNTVITVGQTLDLGVVSPAGASRTLTVRNTGTAPLVVSSLTLSGPNGARFSVTPTALGPLAVGASADVVVTVLPGAPGALTATLTPTDNDAMAQVLPLAATVLSYTTDTDGDGLSDGAEVGLAAMGFDWQVAQPDLVSAYQNGANGAGYYTLSQLQALNVNAPLLARNPDTGLFNVTIGLQQSTNLTTFAPFPVNAGQVFVDGQGRIRVFFAGTNDAAFYRLTAE